MQEHGASCQRRASLAKASEGRRTCLRRRSPGVGTDAGIAFLLCTPRGGVVWLGVWGDRVSIVRPGLSEREVLSVRFPGFLGGLNRYALS